MSTKTKKNKKCVYTDEAKRFMKRIKELKTKYHKSQNKSNKSKKTKTIKKK